LKIPSRSSACSWRFGGLLRRLTGSEVYDAAASMAIGVLLVAAAIRLGADNRELLIGRAADPEQLTMIRSQIEATPGISALPDLQTMHLGPDHLIVAANVGSMTTSALTTRRISQT
jgi:divalent metal cation (Fe/Co/Zn/Cd) transporter